MSQRAATIQSLAMAFEVVKAMQADNFGVGRGLSPIRPGGLSRGHRGPNGLGGRSLSAEWERFLTDLFRRGLTGQGLEMICVDGGAGLLAALPTVFPGIPVQRCWAHYADLRIMPTNGWMPAPEGVIAAMGAA